MCNNHHQQASKQKSTKHYYERKNDLLNSLFDATMNFIWRVGEDGKKEGKTGATLLIKHKYP